MGGVNFRDLETGLERAAGSGGEIRDDLIDLRDEKSFRQIVAGVEGKALGATGVHPPSLGGIGAPPDQGTAVLALRPACANWMPERAPCS